MKGITLGENVDKALTDTSKFVFGQKPKTKLLVSVSALSMNKMACEKKPVKEIAGVRQRGWSVCYICMRKKVCLNV